MRNILIFINKRLIKYLWHIHTVGCSVVVNKDEKYLYELWDDLQGMLLMNKAWLKRGFIVC